MIPFDAGPRGRRLPGHLRDRGRRRGHGQCLDRDGHRRGRLRRPGRQARQPRGRRAGRAAPTSSSSWEWPSMSSPRSSAAASTSWASRSCSPRGSIPGLEGVAPVRRQLPFRTIFNLVGPALQPGQPRAPARRGPARGPRPADGRGPGEGRVHPPGRRRDRLATASTR